jgi:hypothetical protein
MPGTFTPAAPLRAGPLKTRPVGARAYSRLSARAAAAREHEGTQRNVPSRDGEHHDDALRRLDDAVAEQKRRRHQFDAAFDTPGEPAAFVQVCEANEQVSTRRRWLRWVDHHHHY